MKELNVTHSLILAIFLGSAGARVSNNFQKGLDAALKGDYATARREWKSLAEQGNAAAQFQFGWMYSKGEGVPQDDKTAVKWL